MGALGKRIIDGLKDAVAGNFASVTIDGQHWVRAPEWQPIETAPKDGSSIWLWNGREMIVGWWETARPFPGSSHFNDWCSGHETAGIYDAGFTRVYGPTHWMPLPTPPADHHSAAASSAESSEADGLQSPEHIGR